MVWPFNRKRNQPKTLDELKGLTRVLFIDDEEDFGIFEILRNEGWRVTDRREMESFENGDLQMAHVVFVDIHGVGKVMGFGGEGLGLAKAIKQRWPEKLVVIYSAQRRGDRFAPEFDVVDHRIAKDSEPYEFVQTIERLARQAFDPTLVAQRLAAHLIHAGVSLPKDELDKKIRKLMSTKGSLDVEEVAKILSTTGQIAHAVVSIIAQVRS
jgi:DNA-binding NarL/FixJ family response regulator